MTVTSQEIWKAEESSFIWISLCVCLLSIYISANIKKVKKWQNTFLLLSYSVQDERRVRDVLLLSVHCGFPVWLGRSPDLSPLSDNRSHKYDLSSHVSSHDDISQMTRTRGRC